MERGGLLRYTLQLVSIVQQDELWLGTGLAKR